MAVGGLGFLWIAGYVVAVPAPRRLPAVGEVDPPGRPGPVAADEPASPPYRTSFRPNETAASPTRTTVAPRRTPAATTSYSPETRMALTS